MRTCWYADSTAHRPRFWLHCHPPAGYTQFMVYVHGATVKASEESNPLPFMNKGLSSAVCKHNFHTGAVLRWLRAKNEHVHGAGSRRQMDSVGVVAEFILTYANLSLILLSYMQVYSARRYCVRSIRWCRHSSYGCDPSVPPWCWV